MVPPADESEVDPRAAGSAASPPASALVRRTVGAGFWMLSGVGIQDVLRLAVLTILARLLGPAEFGLAAAATVVISFFRIFLQTGIRPAVVQRPVLEERHVRTAFTLALAIGVLSAALVASWSREIAAWSFAMPELAPILVVVSLLLPIQSAGVVAGSLLERELRFSWIVRREVLSYLLGYALVGVGMAYAGFGVWALVGAYLAQELSMTAFSLYAQPHPKRLLLDRAAARELLYFGSGFAAGRIGNYGASNGGNWVAGRWLGSEALGYFKYAFELTGVVGSLFGSVLDKVLFPALAKVQQDRELLAAAYRRGVGISTAAVLPVSAVLFVAAPEIVRLVLGPGWDPVVAPFRVLALALVVRTTATMSDSLARATGAGYRRAWRQFVYAGLVVALAFWGQRFGLPGLALGVCIAILANSLLMIHLSMTLAALSWRHVLVAHVAALPSFLIAASTMTLAVGAGRASALPDAATLAASLAVTGIALLVALRLGPRLLLGRDGAAALATILRVVVERFPALPRIPFAGGVIASIVRAAGRTPA